MVAKDKYMQWLRLNTCVQSGNDILTSEETNIPTNAREGQVLAIHAVEIGNPSVPPVDGAWMQVTIATRAGLGPTELTMNGPDVIALHEIRATLLTSGLSVYEVYKHITYPKAFLVAHPSLFVYVTSALTAQPNVGRVRLGFTFEKVTAEEFFQALAEYGA